MDTILHWYPIGTAWLGIEHYPASNQSNSTAILVHGFRAWHRWGFFPYIARTLSSFNIATSVIALPSSGYGPAGFQYELFATGTISTDLEALRYALDNVRRDSEHVIGIGHSRGALLLALCHWQLDCLTMWSPPRYFGRWSDRQRAEWRLRGMFNAGSHLETGKPLLLNISYLDDLEQNDYNAQLDRALVESNTPTCVIVGQQDMVAPPRQAEELFAVLQMSNRCLRIIPGAGHTFGISHGSPMPTPPLMQALNATLEFLRTCCPQSGNFASNAIINGTQ
ncbi:MAG: alpha/beta hydrolase [Chlorobi bacterium]|nr:alpha/beta hydrolase [Chlorobiota bacterium]